MREIPKKTFLNAPVSQRNRKMKLRRLFWTIQVHSTEISATKAIYSVKKESIKMSATGVPQYTKHLFLIGTHKVTLPVGQI